MPLHSFVNCKGKGFAYAYCAVVVQSTPRSPFETGTNAVPFIAQGSKGPGTTLSQAIVLACITRVVLHLHDSQIVIIRRTEAVHAL